MIRGDVIADVGSDHAYLPIWLYLNKKIKKAYALDISENCVNRVKTNIEKYNISHDIIVPVLSDGLACFDSEFDFSELTDIIIAGMGGENIAGIIRQTLVKRRVGVAAPYINFILQPNSKMRFLREFLRENDFDILEDIIIESKKRRYIVINARLRGQGQDD